MKQNTYCNDKVKVVRDFDFTPENLGKIEMKFEQIFERLVILQDTKDKMERKFNSVLVDNMIGYGVDCEKEKESKSRLLEQLDFIINKIDGLVYQLDSITGRCEL